LLHVDVRKNVHIAEPDSTNKHIIFMTKGMPQDDIMAINGMAYRKIQKIFDLTHEKTKKNSALKWIQYLLYGKKSFQVNNTQTFGDSSVDLVYNLLSCHYASGFVGYL